MGSVTEVHTKQRAVMEFLLVECQGITDIHSIGLLAKIVLVLTDTMPDSADIKLPRMLSDREKGEEEEEDEEEDNLDVRMLLLPRIKEESETSLSVKEEISFEDNYTDYNIPKIFNTRTCEVPALDYNGNNYDLVQYGKNSYPCFQCSKFTNEMSLRRHMKLKHLPSNEKIAVSCSACGKKFKEKPAFSQRAVLARHMSVHNDIRQYRCDVCDKAFKMKGDLRNHFTSHTSEKQFSCEACGKRFKQKASVSRHMLMHRSSLPPSHSCDVCGKAFGLRCKLKRHMKVHSYRRDHCCHLCSRAFSESSNLKRHMSVHTVERPFSCDVCGKSFGNRASIVSHVKYHLNDRAFFCNICHKSFIFCSTLKNHLYLHSEVRPFPCTLCEKSYTQRSGLREHMLKVHGI